MKHNQEKNMPYNEKRSHAFTWILSFVGIGAILWFCFGQNLPFFASSTTGERGIFVTGEATIETISDIAHVTLGVEVGAETAEEARNKNAAVMKRILSKLKSLGVKEEDIQTSELRLFPERSYSKSAKREVVVGYHLSNQVTLTVRDLAKLSTVIDEAITSGATNVENISYNIASSEEWEEKAMEAAIKKARNKAEAMAAAAGVTIKGIRFIKDTQTDTQPYRLTDTIKGPPGRGAETPLMEGKITIHARVEMGFGI